MTVNLPAWSGIDVNNKQKIENPLEIEKTEQDIDMKDQPGPAKENSVKATKQAFVKPDDLMYSNVGEVQELKAAQSNQVPQYHSVSPHKEETIAMESGDKESSVYETVFPVQTGPSQLVSPPKPLPYSLSKKLNSTSGDDGSLRPTEKVPSMFFIVTNFNGTLVLIIFLSILFTCKNMVFGWIAIATDCPLNWGV